MQNNQSLKAKISSAPHAPGIYLLKNEAGGIIYVGKASDLKKRLQSYLHKSTSQRAYENNLIEEAQQVQWKRKGTEIEALLSESHKIKKLQPKYNILMRDDKNYFYLALTREKFPRIKITHQPPKDERTIGPFTSGTALRASLKALRKIFPYCSCKHTHKTPCTNYYLDLDPGYCCSSELRKKEGASLEKLQKKYKSNLEALIGVVSGERKKVIKQLKEKMQKASRKQNYEQAATLRDQIEGLETTIAHKKVISQNLIQNELWQKFEIEEPPERIEAYDVSNLSGKQATASMVVFTKHQEPDLGLEAASFCPAKEEYRHFKIKTVHQSDDPAMLKEALKRRLKHEEWKYPEIVIADGGKAQHSAFLEVKGKLGAQFRVFAVAKQSSLLYTENDKFKLDSMPQPLTYLFQSITKQAHQFAISYHRKLRNKKVNNQT